MHNIILKAKNFLNFSRPAILKNIKNLLFYLFYFFFLKIATICILYLVTKIIPKLKYKMFDYFQITLIPSNRCFSQDRQWPSVQIFRRKLKRHASKNVCCMIQTICQFLSLKMFSLVRGGLKYYIKQALNIQTIIRKCAVLVNNVFCSLNVIKLL